MQMSGAKISSVPPAAIPSRPQARFGRKSTLFQVNYGLRTLRTQNRIVQWGKNTRNNCMLNWVSSASNSSNVSVSDVPFPTDYAELLQQAKEATESAMKDKIQLMEIEFPTSGLLSVPGDGEGGTEMTESMQLIREFCDRLVTPEKATRTRIFFPEASEVKVARKSAFEGVSFKLDYLTKPSFFEDFGFGTKVKMADRVRPEDELFLVAYPYFNVNEMLVVEELYKDAVADTSRQLIIFNGEIDRIRSGCILFRLEYTVEIDASSVVYLSRIMNVLLKELLSLVQEFKTIHHFSIRSWRHSPRPCFQKWRQCITFTILKAEVVALFSDVILGPGRCLKGLETGLSACINKIRCHP